MKKNISYNVLNILIEDYISCAKYSCSLLKQLYNGKENFLRAKVLKLIPKKGYIENVYYNFHGSGCYFEYDNNTIDIDFGPNDRCDGFDLFRLKDFFKSLKDKEKYQEIKNEEQFEKQFIELIKAEIIYNPKIEPNPHLFYLKENSLNNVVQKCH